jgi:hypothetical protein
LFTIRTECTGRYNPSSDASDIDASGQAPASVAKLDIRPLGEEVVLSPAGCVSQRMCWETAVSGDQLLECSDTVGSAVSVSINNNDTSAL